MHVVNTFQLSAAKNGTGTGAISSTPAGLTCPSGACSATFPPGTKVVLTATPGASNRFDGFGGDCSGNACSFNMSADHSVSATFIPEHTLTVNLAGSGSVASTPGGGGRAAPELAPRPSQRAPTSRPPPPPRRSARRR